MGNIPCRFNSDFIGLPSIKEVPKLAIRSNYLLKATGNVPRRDSMQKPPMALGGTLAVEDSLLELGLGGVKLLEATMRAMLPCFGITSCLRLQVQVDLWFR